MAQYKVLQKSFINDCIIEEGEIITLEDGTEVSDNLELVIALAEESNASKKA